VSAIVDRYDPYIMIYNFGLKVISNISRLEVEQGIQQSEAPVSTLNRVLNAIDVGASSTFNPHMDVQKNMFVAMETCDDDRAKGIPFLWQK
jgi:hypothetical protein